MLNSRIALRSSADIPCIANICRRWWVATGNRIRDFAPVKEAIALNILQQALAVTSGGKSPNSRRRASKQLTTFFKELADIPEA